MAIIVDNFSGTPLEGKGVIIEVDYAARTDDQPVYIGWGAPDTLTSDASWKISFQVYDSSNRLIRRRWADGDTKFDNRWDDRTTLNYS